MIADFSTATKNKSLGLTDTQWKKYWKLYFRKKKTEAREKNEIEEATTVSKEIGKQVATVGGAV